MYICANAEVFLFVFKGVEKFIQRNLEEKNKNWLYYFEEKNIIHDINIEEKYIYGIMMKNYLLVGYIGRLLCILKEKYTTSC